LRKNHSKRAGGTTLTTRYFLTLEKSGGGVTGKGIIGLHPVKKSSQSERWKQLSKKKGFFLYFLLADTISEKKKHYSWGNLTQGLPEISGVLAQNKTLNLKSVSNVGTVLCRFLQMKTDSMSLQGGTGLIQS